MSSSDLPKFVYKIIPTAPPEPLPTEYPLSELDQTDGFVHMSTAEQVQLLSQKTSYTNPLWSPLFETSNKYVLGP